MRLGRNNVCYQWLTIKFNFMEELRYELLKVIYEKKIQIIESLIDCQRMQDERIQEDSKFALRCLNEFEHSIMATELPKA